MMRDHKPQIREGVFVLDWLARNLHEWPAVTPKIIPSGDDVFEHGANFCGDYVEIIGCIGLYTKDKWIRRRRELGLEVCEMNDLDWLARNVHKWPAGHQGWLYIITNGDGTKGVATSLIGQVNCPWVRIEIQDWLARRAELQNKPSWDAMQEWVTHIAQYKTGKWAMMKNAKGCMDEGWRADRIETTAALCGEILGDWRDTLEKRPKSDEAKSDDTPIGRIEGSEYVLYDPFVSVEDAATAKQPAPKGSGNPILGMVLADLTNRALEGKEKYGEPLLAHNGRNPLWDAYQEALDLAMYLRQAIEEQNK